MTLFTTDANLFADVRSSAHVSGLERFWRRIQRLSSAASETSTTSVAAVTIMIVETTSVMEMMKTIKSSYSDDLVAGNRQHYAVNGDSSSLDSSPWFLPNRLHVMQCANDIRQRIRELNQANESDSASSLARTTPNVNLQFMEGNAASFQTLLQTWVKESFAQTYAPSPLCSSISGSGVGNIGGGGVQGRLSFDLPETLDGIMCSISLDLQYATLPHRIDSPATLGLVEDMRRLSTLSPSSVEVLQTIPLSSVDSSLIYGVPMSARAGFVNDVSRYDEMKILARQLWKYLSRNDVGLVLRVRGDELPGEDLEKGGGPASNSPLGYYSPSGEQLFLLVYEEAVEKPQPQAFVDHDSELDPPEALNVVPDRRPSRCGAAPCHGTLYRYATKSQNLLFGNEEKGHEEDENAKEMSDHYLDYIERSLDALVKTGLNPLLMDGGIYG